MIKKGMTTLSIVMIISSVLIYMSVDLVLRNIEREKTLFHKSQILEVSNTVEACMEEGLLKLNGNHAYMGESFYFDDIFCIIEVTVDGEDLRTLRAYAHTDTIYSKEITAQVDISSALEILSWSSD